TTGSNTTTGNTATGSTGATGGAATGGGGAATTSGAGGAPGDASVGSGGGGGGGGPGGCRPAMGTSPKKPIRPQTTVPAAVTKFFSSTDAFVQGTVLPNIDKNRKSDATLKLVTPDGRPAAGYQMSAVLVNPDFHWGACPPRPTMGSESNPGPTEEKLW